MTLTRRSPRGADAAHAAHVEFLIDGVLSEAALANFPELSMRRGPAGGSVLYGTAVDVAHVDGLFARFRALEITVVEFRQRPL